MRAVNEAPPSHHHRARQSSPAHTGTATGQVNRAHHRHARTGQQGQQDADPLQTRHISPPQASARTTPDEEASAHQRFIDPDYLGHAHIASAPDQTSAERHTGHSASPARLEHTTHHRDAPARRTSQPQHQGNAPSSGGVMVHQVVFRQPSPARVGAGHGSLLHVVTRQLPHRLTLGSPPATKRPARPTHRASHHQVKAHRRASADRPSRDTQARPP